MAAGDTVSKKCMIPRGPDVSYMPVMSRLGYETVAWPRSPAGGTLCGVQNSSRTSKCPVSYLMSDGGLGSYNPIASAK